MHIVEAADLRIVITRGESRSEEIIVREKELRTNPTVREEACQRVFAKLYQEGYALKGTYGGGYNYHIESALIFAENQ